MEEKVTAREPLTRHALIEAALRIADSEGLEAVSLRRVARDFGVTPMALYRYVDSKEGLLAGISEHVLGEFELPSEETGDWREELRALARSFRRLLVAHPAVAALFSLHPPEIITPNGWRIVEIVLRTLREAGFPPREAALLEDECERFVLALVMLETGGRPRESKLGAHVEEVRAQLAKISPEEFPNVAEAIPFITKHPDPDWAFELALDLIIGGLERLLEGGGLQLDRREYDQSAAGSSGSRDLSA
jgi:TetR/AcrR family tetracycline transcriptional repressor